MKYFVLIVALLSILLASEYTMANEKAYAVANNVEADDKQDFDEELKKNSQEAIREVFSWLQETKVFVKEQAPLFVRELLTFKLWTHVFYSCLCFLGIAVCFSFYKNLQERKKMREEKFCIDTDSKDRIAFIKGYAGMFVGMAVAILMFYNLYYVIYISIAPRVYLIDMLSKMIK